MKYAIQTLPARAAKTALVLAMLGLSSGVAWAEKINLNTADAEAIAYIPGIGPGKAQKIIEVREQLGKFSSMDDVDAVPGIGEATMQDILKHGSLDSGVDTLTDEMRDNIPQRSSSNTSTKRQNSESS